MKPLAIDLFCGLGGWTSGLLDEGWEVIGFDIERHVYGDQRYPAQLVVQDVLTLHGSQFKDAALIVCSPPCQFFSYCAMPWSRAKALAASVRSDPVQLAARLELFDACFRIQREACEAAGRHIPMVVENVRGAQPWVGRARFAYGSFFLWGDVPLLMPRPVRARKNAHVGGGSWFAIGSPGQISVNGNPDGRKNPGFRFDGSGRSFQTESVDRHVEGVKVKSETGRSPAPGSGARFTSRDCGVEAAGLKHGGDWFSDPSSPSSPSRQGGQVKVKADGRKGAGAEWFDGNLCVKSSNSLARKLASAQIAKIPERLSRHIGRVYHPDNEPPALMPTQLTLEGL